MSPKPAPAEQVWLAPGAMVPSATPEAASGAEFVEVPCRYDAILLSSFGGPEGQDDVIPFLRNVTAGRGIPDERLELVATHYRHHGGVSPINAQNRELRAKLEQRLAERGLPLPVLWGNRNWEPYLNQTISQAHQAGHHRLLAIATSAYSSYSSCRQYREDWADALADTGLASTVQIDKVRPFFNHPGFVTGFVEGVRQGLADARAAGFADEQITVLFTTHSIPLADAERSGDPARDYGQRPDGGRMGAYEAEHLEVAEYIAAQACPTTAWQLVYQSRSGPPSQPWLEPDILDVIGSLPTANTPQGGAVIIVPIGFVSDHMEVLWDLDNEALTAAQEAGLWAVRVATPGVQDSFVDGLVDLILERVHAVPVAQRKAFTPLGVGCDVCRPGCCENPRLGFRPAIAGVAP